MIFEKLSVDVLADSYFKSLVSKICKNFAHEYFGEESPSEVTDIELVHLLRFADILSNSLSAEARNSAYQIISRLYSRFKDNPLFKTYSVAVLSKLGNFPGLYLLNNYYKTSIDLPFDREIEKDLKEIIQKAPGKNDYVFTDSQYELFSKLISSEHFSFSGPTSMGKSFLIRSFIETLLGRGDKINIAIIVPTRALINQCSLEMQKALKELLQQSNYKVLTNSNVGALAEEKNLNYIFVLTSERLLSFLATKDKPKLNYIFIDEAHKMEGGKDDYRSVTTYLAVEKTLEFFPDIKMYFASPNVSNPEIFLKLFDKKIEKNTFHTVETPVQQNLFYINLLDGKTLFRSEQSDDYIFEPRMSGKFENALDVVYALGKDQSNIIYCSSRGLTVENAQKFHSYLGDVKPELSEGLKRAIKIIKGYIHKDYYLIDCLQNGIGFHFGSLPQMIRSTVEELFKAGEIKYLFCTSTLLEGVNLPAKNIFILKNKNGNSNMSRIDFLNLGGRAGRLRQELYGNIICIRETEKEWKDINLLDRKTKIEIKPTILNKTERGLLDIKSILEKKPVKFGTDKKENLFRYLSNIIVADSVNPVTTRKSPLINNLTGEKGKEILKIAKEIADEIEVPYHIIVTNQSIDLRLQDQLYKYLKKNVNDQKIILPKEIKYETCLSILNDFFEKYNWEKTESKFKNNNTLKYYALLMNQWINGSSLSQMINNEINFYHETRREISFFTKKEKFDRNDKRHINQIINEMIDNIDKVLRFTLEKYFNNYYLLLSEVLGEEKSGVNWALFLEYGSRNLMVIALQNLGFSRPAASYLLINHNDCLEKKDDKLSGINKEKLLAEINPEASEFDEIVALL